jgi:4-amino-4-deoxy-L-arabinose transferase-like glycosyltransferase
MSPSRGVTFALALLLAAGTIGGVFGGPALGDHEAIVAQCARNMRLSGDWVSPEIFGTPFFRKPPLPYWLIAGVSYLLPNDPGTGLPVTDLAARLPSGVAALVTVLLMWQLAGSMFGRRVGVVAATMAGASLVFLLYAPNATAEILLTMCCTWAFVHFWYAATARSALPRFAHAMLFYVALGVGMLAKGPAPIALVAMPLFVWWYSERPLRVLARRGIAGWRLVTMCLLRGLWPRTRQAFTRLWLLPGLIVFAAIFVPWMLAVAERYPHAWNLWNWQYWQRAQGNYEDTRVRYWFYYIPIAVGLTLPWAFLIIEALLAPWLKRYARWHRALLYVGLWAVLGVAVMSKMDFKKPYYIVPAIPGLLLLMSVVADRAFCWRPGRDPISWTLRIGTWSRSILVRNPYRLAWIVWGVVAIGAIPALVTGVTWLQRTMPAASTRMALMAGGCVLLLLLAGILYIRGRTWHAFGLTAVTTVVAFQLVWHACTQTIDVMDEVTKVAALAEALDAAGAPPRAKVLWTDRRPDSRLGFYFNRDSTYLVTPEEIVTQMVDRTSLANQKQMQAMVFKRAAELLRSPEPVYLILQQRSYELVRGSLARNVRAIATTKDRLPAAKDWIVVTNAPAGPGR